MAVSNARKRRPQVVHGYTQTTTVIIATTATVEVPVTLHIPPPTDVSSVEFAMITLPPQEPGSGAALVTSLPVTVLTDAVFRVIDRVHGIFQQYTLKQTSLGENVSSVVTLHEMTVFVPTGATLLGTPVGSISGAASQEGLASPTKTPSTTEWNVYPGNNTQHSLPTWMAGVFVICALIVVVMCGLWFKKRMDEKRAKTAEDKGDSSEESISEKQLADYMYPLQAYEASERNNPEEVAFAARVRAGMDLMIEMQQKNRKKKTAPCDEYAHKY